jgi:hypothetical protein
MTYCAGSVDSYVLEWALKSTNEATSNPKLAGEPMNRGDSAT